jgi:hypothetical protein
VFWEPDVDFFGVTQQGGEATRGRCFMFWNLARFNGGVPLLASLVSGRSARDAEGADPEEVQEHMLTVRRVEWHPWAAAAVRAGDGMQRAAMRALAHPGCSSWRTCLA